MEPLQALLVFLFEPITFIKSFVDFYDSLLNVHRLIEDGRKLVVGRVKGL